MGFHAIFIWLLAVFAWNASAAEPAKKAHKAQKETLLSPMEIWSPTCAVYPIDPKKWSGEKEKPDIFNKNEKSCYNAIAIPKGVEELPPFFAYVGQDKNHCIRPITQKPESHLEDGDILVYFRGVDYDSKSLYQHVSKGRWHAAIVGKDKNGKLAHYDSPSSMSGNNFSNGTYHILRLRPYPPEVQSDQDLKIWQQDPVKKAKLKEFAEKREKLLKDSLEVLNTINETGYSYDVDRKTEVSIDQTLQSLRKQYQDTKSCPKMSLYCSELAITPFVIAGLKLPKSQSIFESIERIEKTVLPEFVKNGKSREAAVDDSLNHLFADAAMLLEMGVSEDELNAFRRTGKIPAQAETARSLYKKLLMAGPIERPLMMMAMNFASASKGQIVSPSDLFDSIYDPKGSFAYVGSFVGQQSCSIGGHLGNAQLGEQQDGPDRKAEADKNHLLTISQHQHSLQNIQVSPDGTKVVTVSEDGSAKVLDLKTGETKTLPHSVKVNSAQFSSEGSKVVTASNDGTAKIIDLNTGETKTISHSNWVYNAQFSPDGSKVITASEDGTAKIFDLKTGETKTIQHSLRVLSALFSSDSSKVVTASSDGTAKILDLKTGETKMIQHSSSINSAQFSPDGKWIISRDTSKYAYLFSVDEITTETLHKAFRGYNDLASVTGSEREKKLDKAYIDLRLLLLKAKQTGTITRDQALKLMNEHIDTAEFRGFVGSTQQNTHVMGLINQVFPPPTPAP